MCIIHKNIGHTYWGSTDKPNKRYASCSRTPIETKQMKIFSLKLHTSPSGSHLCGGFRARSEGFSTSRASQLSSGCESGSDWRICCAHSWSRRTSWRTRVASTAAPRTSSCAPQCAGPSRAILLLHDDIAGPPVGNPSISALFLPSIPVFHAYSLPISVMASLENEIIQKSQNSSEFSR